VGSLVELEVFDLQNEFPTGLDRELGELSAELDPLEADLKFAVDEGD